MKIALTHKIVARYTDRAYRTFELSDRPKYEKRVFKDMLPFVQPYLSKSLKTTWGQAYLLDMDDQLVWTMPVETDGYYIEPLGDFYHIVMELNWRILQWARPQDTYDTVTHELAHCLDYCLRGDTHHDKYWRALTISMGGTGLTLADTKVPDYVYEENIFTNKHLRKGYHDSY